jgi:hypothetical protein
MDIRSRSGEDPATAPNSPGTDREERLLRFVDSLRAEQIRASAAANAEGDKAGFSRPGRGLLWVVVLAVMGTAAALLLVLGPPHVHQNAVPSPATGTALVQSAPQPALIGQPTPLGKSAEPQPSEKVTESGAATIGPDATAPIRLMPGAPSSSSPHPSEPVPAEERTAEPPNAAAAATPPAVAPTRPEPIVPLPPQQEAGAAASPSPTRATVAVSEPETIQPVLRVYYPHGSLRGEANARSLAAQIGSNVARADVEAQSDLTMVAVVRAHNRPVADAYAICLEN